MSTIAAASAGDSVMASHELNARAAVVIAAYNEGTMIADVVLDARRMFPNVVVVDDGSVPLCLSSTVLACTGQNSLRSRLVCLI